MTEHQMSKKKRNICTHNSLQHSITLGHKMFLFGGTSDQPKVWPKVNLTQSLFLGVLLTKCQSDLKSDQMSTWTKASSRGVHLTKCQPDMRPHSGESICLSTEKSSDFLTHYKVLLLLHRSFFIQKTNKLSTNQTHVPDNKQQTNNNNDKTKKPNIFLVVSYTKGLSERFKKLHSKLEIQAHFRGHNTISTFLGGPKDKDTTTQKSGFNISFQMCPGRLWGRIHCRVGKILWEQA